MGQSLNALAEEYRMVLRMSDLSPRTIEGKTSALNLFLRWANDNSLTDVSTIKPKHMRAFFLYRQDQGAGKGVLQQNYIHLNVFFKWVKREHRKALKHNPLEKVDKPVYKPPVIEFPEVDIIDKMIATCDDSFNGHRDRLLLLLYKETGARASEILQITEWDLNQDEQTVNILFGKGGKKREVPYGNQTAIAVVQYLIARKKHKYAHMPKLFLGQQGELGYEGTRQMFRRRSLMVTDKPIKPHGLRHAFVHKAKQTGISEDALMELMGWSSRVMLDHYALSMRKERALEEYRKKMQSKEE